MRKYNANGDNIYELYVWGYPVFLSENTLHFVCVKGSVTTRCTIKYCGGNDNPSGDVLARASSALVF